MALESAIIGKPALTFGSTWYDGCPNIYNWHNNISYDDIVEAEIKNTDSIVDFLIELKNKFFIPAYMNFGQQLMFPEYNVENFNKLQNDNLYKLMKYFLKNLTMKNNQKPFLIAEIGGNHEGDFKKALELTKLAIESKVDCIKFQIYDADSLVNKISPERHAHFKKFELEVEQYIELAKICKK